MSRVFRLPDQAAADALQKRLTGKTQVRQHQPASPDAAAAILASPKRGKALVNWSVELSRQIRLAGLPAPILEYPFAKTEGRKFRADLAFPSLLLLVEIDGAVHRIKARFQGDLERDQWLFFSPWRKLRVSPAQVRSGAALHLVEQALASRL